MGIDKDGEGMGQRLRSSLLKEYSVEEACEFGFSLPDLLEYLDQSLKAEDGGDGERAELFVKHLSQPCWVCQARLSELQKIGQGDEDENANGREADALKILAGWYFRKRKSSKSASQYERDGEAEKTLPKWADASAVNDHKALASALRAIVNLHFPTQICQLIAREWDRLAKEHAGRTVFLWEGNGELKVEVFRLGAGSPAEGEVEAKRRGLPSDCLCVYFPLEGNGK